MSVQLLDKTRKLQKLLHNNQSSDKVVFNDICEVLKQVLESNVLVLSRRGKVLGSGKRDEIPPLSGLIKDAVGSHIDNDMNERLLSILSTKENLNLQMLGFDTEASEKYSAIAAPIDIAGNRNGTLFMYRVSKPYSIDDIILAEYATTVVGLEIVRSKNEESAAVLRGQKVAESAFASLSVMEAEAVRQVFDELQGTEGILVTSRVADKARITRSVIVNALRKLESAGVIESRSSGMKGTYIKVLNDNIFAFLTPDQQ
ncbi:MAG: GTP-sensing pleiotropic transcriptional regulator CodY [Lachnospiraceae bacterium]|nr:GTP-sensing pleiotropic transcriptional regulator CodY [Lachnospiraceae bacterium]